MKKRSQDIVVSFTLKEGTKVDKFRVPGNENNVYTRVMKSVREITNNFDFTEGGTISITVDPSQEDEFANPER